MLLSNLFYLRFELFFSDQTILGQLLKCFPHVFGSLLFDVTYLSTFSLWSCLFGQSNQMLIVNFLHARSPIWKWTFVIFRLLIEYGHLSLEHYAFFIEYITWLVYLVENRVNDVLIVSLIH